MMHKIYLVKSTVINCIAFLLLFLSIDTGFSQVNNSTTETKTVKKIESYLAAIEKAGFNGSVLVELNGKVVLSNGYGFSNLNSKIKNTSNTIFDIGTITKQFTAAAILKLEMQGKLSTTDKIAKYFSNVPMDKSEITLHDLLRHQAGLPGVVGGDYDAITESAFIDSVMKLLTKFLFSTDSNYVMTK